MAAQVLVFALGAVFSVVLQLFISRLALGREKRKEAWVRRLNSYENFCRAVTQLTDLFSAGVNVPEDQFWLALADARKSAYDAVSYDPSHSERTTQMRELTLELVLSYQRDEIDSARLGTWRQTAEAVRDTFYKEEGIR